MAFFISFLSVLKCLQYRYIIILPNLTKKPKKCQSHNISIKTRFESISVIIYILGYLRFVFLKLPRAKGKMDILKMSIFGLFLAYFGPIYNS